MVANLIKITKLKQWRDASDADPTRALKTTRTSQFCLLPLSKCCNCDKKFTTVNEQIYHKNCQQSDFDRDDDQAEDRKKRRYRTRPNIDDLPAILIGNFHRPAESCRFYNLERNIIW